MQYLSLLFFLLFFSSFTIIGQIINVPGDQPTIQAGMDAASPGDTVLVADGTYTGEGNLYLSFGGKAIVVKSANGPANCIIDCVNGTGVQAFLITKSETEGSVVDGFKIINGCWVIFIESSTPTIRNNILDGNNSGIYTRYGDGTIIENNTIINSNEDGIYCLNSSPVIRNNTISASNLSGIYCRNSNKPIIESNNISESEYYGIKCYNASPDIKGNAIHNNKDAGIYCNISAPTIIGNRISENGIQNAFQDYTSTVYDNHNRPYKTYVSTTFEGTGNYGGILITETSSPVIQNNIIASNKAIHTGGIYCDNSSSATITNNNLVGNTSILAGAVCTESSSVEIINNIILSSKSNENSTRNLVRWYKHSLLWVYNYEGAKTKSITYYYGFINKGDPGVATITAFGMSDMTFTVQTGERYWIEVTSQIDEWGEGGGIQFEVTLWNESLIYTMDVYQGGIGYYEDFIYTSQGLSQEGLSASAIAAIGQSLTPTIEYNDFYINQGSMYIKGVSEDPGELNFSDLSGIDGNISLDPLIEPPNYLLGETSPCIDAGNPDASFNDSSLPPGMGTDISDIGAYGGPGNRIITDIKDDNLLWSNNYINDYKLFQNYPNPFNPTTTVRYKIPELSFVTLKIFDVLGNEIATLVNEEKAIGNYEVELNAKGLSSGVYFYRLQIYSVNGGGGNYVETKKMVLLH